MRRLWVDANVLIRFITRDPADMAERAYQLFARAEAGEVMLVLSPVILAEVLWTLESYYGFSREEIAGALIPLVTADGIAADEPAALVEALQMLREKNVDFADAYLAARARQSAEPHVSSFDRDFDRLGVVRLEPPALPGDNPPLQTGR